jgi:CO/xanthine dehydrogenase FAD-binding subunit
MFPEFEYIVPSNLSEAFNFLRDYGSESKIIAGGTDLVLNLRRGEMKPRFLLDISVLKELRQIEEAPDRIRIGAACTHTQISESPVIRKEGRILSEASGGVGSRQIRNLGTIGGNIVNASPAADTLPALMVLNAQLRIVSQQSHRQVPLPEIYKGPYQTHLKSDELVSHILIDRIPQKARYHFFRIARRKAMATARINGAVVLWRAELGGPIEEIRISVGSVTPVPCRMTEAEKLLRGTVPSEELIEQACLMIGKAMLEASGIRKSAEYKQPVVQTLVKRALQDALKG